MILVGAIAAVLWVIGMVMGTPRRARWIMIMVLMAGVFAVQLALPDGHPLRAATGGDARFWGLLIGFAGVMWAYRRGLRALRDRALAGQISGDSAQSTPAPGGTFSQAELSRYARHLMLREMGGPGQKKLKAAKVLVVGAGGLGAPVLMYLAAAGVGTIGVIDEDTVDLTNLHRQIIHTDAQVGQPKVKSAQDAMLALNPNIVVRPYARRLTADIAAELLADYDLVLDGTDNFETRYLVNQICVQLGKPLIAAAITQWEGQISLYHPKAGGPCFQCLFPQAPAPGLVPSCAEAGVIGPLPGVIGSMMALEAVKWITGAGTGLLGRLMIYDGLYADSRVISARSSEDCPICAAHRTLP